MKKALKIFGISILIIFILLIVIPFAFHGQIKEMVKDYVNDNVNAKVDFSDVSLSFIRSFPNAHVAIKDLKITNYAPFEDEIFATAKKIAFKMSVKELFKNTEETPMIVNSIIVDEALLTLKTDKHGNTNYDITKEDTDASETETEATKFSLSLKKYEINRSALAYVDEASNTRMYITELKHSGQGVFSDETSELKTKSEANVSFSIDSTEYLNNNTIKLDAQIGLDLANSKYTFKDNTGYINELPLKFQGFVQQLDEGILVDISFENPESDFKNFLAVIPKVYSKNIEQVKTTGDFRIKGSAKGMVTEETIPKFDISITSNNASFKYPDLPKEVRNIIINTEIKNATGKIEDTYVAIKTLNFKIDQDVFKSSATLKNITENMLVNATVDGTLNLANITKVYPVELDNTLSGILKANLNTSFDMKAIETNAVSRIKNKGSVNISDFVFSSEDIVNPIHIKEAKITFNPKTVSLNTFKAITGDSDLNATGTIQNLLGFLLKDGTLKGNFSLNSNLFKVSDFMTAEGESKDNKTTKDTESLKIPAFLDCSIYANAKTVVYDNLNLKDVTGTLIIKDQQVTLQNLNSNIFNGVLSVKGHVSTKTEMPTFNLDLGANGFNVGESYENLELLQKIAPIAKLIQGELNTNINLAGTLDSEFSPNLETVSGNLFAELLNTDINTKEGTIISKLQKALSFINFDKLNLNDLKTNLTFNNGKVRVKPFDLKYNDIGITVSGEHGFDEALDYKATFNVPAKYLGSEVNRLVGNIDEEEANNVTIPITANIGGNITNPNVKTNLASGVANLTKQLIEIRKQKLLNRKDKVNTMLGNLIGGNKAETDSIKNTQNNTVKEVLGTIIESDKTQQTDSTEAITTTKKAVKNVLGGLLGGKKKKDSVN